MKVIAELPNCLAQKEPVKLDELNDRQLASEEGGKAKRAPAQAAEPRA